MHLVRAPFSSIRGVTVLTSVVSAALVIGWAARSAAQPTVQFDPKVDFAVGAQPRGVAAGDVNGDGIEDLVVGHWGTSAVSLLLADGIGGFAPAVDLPVGGSPFTVALGDFDGNHTLDIATANAGSNTVTVLLGDGAGHFPVRRDYATGVEPLGVVVVDLNHDGHPDLVTANAEGSVSVFLGNGDGSFASARNIPIGGVPYAIATGDLNVDGKADIVVADQNRGAVVVLLGDGAGGLSVSGTFGVGGAPTSVAVGDLDGDGIPDVACAVGTLSVLHGTGTGTLASPVSYGTAGGATSVAIVDLNLDGAPDVVVTGNGSNMVSVFLGQGVSGLAPRLDFGTGGSPWWVTAGRFNGDDFPDLATSNMGDGTVSLLNQVANRQTTTTALAADPNPSNYGDAITLTATVSPADATGPVDFRDGGTTLGTTSLNAGVATFSITGLLRGTHPLTALYRGNATLRPSISPTVTEVVHGVGSVTRLASSVNPSQLMQVVSFTATVSSATTGPLPIGTVQFNIDGADFGAPVALAAGSATSPGDSTLAVGSHAVLATYLGDSRYDPSTSSALNQVVQPPNPVIVAVRDVPNDQGGHVFITWHSPLDYPGARAVTGYRVWRRAPNPGAAAARRASAGMTVTTRPDGAALEGYWESIATLPAEQLVNYAYDAPTTQDSIAGSNPLTAFFVTALTADAFVFFPSAPDSGYSVDNLAPPTPAPFAASYMTGSTALHWGANPAPDLREYRLYRGLGPQFVPGPDNLVIATRDTGYVDVTPTAYVYKLDAIDIHGNPSHYAVVTPNGPVATLASLVAIDASANRISLGWYSAGNAGLAVTIYRRTAATDWSALRQAMFNGTGFLRFDDTSVQAGMTYGYRLGIMDGGVETFVGEGWATAEAPVLALAGARPNPAVGGALTVAFTLPSAEAANLELIDVSGRRLVARDVGSLGPGAHSVNLAEGTRIPPGIYLLRLSEAGERLTSRVAVLP